MDSDAVASDDEVQGQRNLLVEVFGTPFLCYSLNLTEDELRVLIGASPEPSSVRSAALDALVGLMAQRNITPERAKSDSLLHLDLDVLAHREGPESETWPNRIRTALGGSTNISQVRGLHRQLFLRLARDFYPMFLIPTRTNDLFAPSISGALWHHPLREEIENAVMADPSLAKLFPAETEGSGRMGMVFQSTGSGGTQQL